MAETEMTGIEVAGLTVVKTRLIIETGIGTAEGKLT